MGSDISFTEFFLFLLSIVLFFLFWRLRGKIRRLHHEVDREVIGWNLESGELGGVREDVRRLLL